MKLHLGCGPKHIDGFTNIDVRKLPGVDVIDNVKTLSKYKENSVELIYVSHVLEHIERTEYMSVLTRWHDILQPNGVLRIAVPDMEQIFVHYQKYKDLAMIRGFLWGGQTYRENFHFCGWDFMTLSNELKSIGFRSIERYNWRMTEHAHIDDFSQSYLPHMDKENGMIMSLNVEAVK